MSTRGSYGFHVDSVDKISFNHWDSYPTGLGVEVMEFIKNNTITSMKKIAREIVLVDEDTRPTPEQIKECQQWAETHVSGIPINEGEVDNWYNLLHKAQGDMSAYENGLRYMISSESFLLNSLFCEWAYIINLDSGMLEIYQGFNTTPNGKGRYAKLKRERDYEGMEQYYGVRLVAEFKLDYVQSMSPEKMSVWCERLESLEENEEVSKEEIEKETPIHQTDTVWDAVNVRDAKTACEVLGVNKNASIEEVEEAYIKKAQLYHPDKVASLAPEFMEIAEECMKKINAAREELKRDAEKRPG